MPADKILYKTKKEVRRKESTSLLAPPSRKVIEGMDFPLCKIRFF